MEHLHKDIPGDWDASRRATSFETAKPDSCPFQRNLSEKKVWFGLEQPEQLFDVILRFVLNVLHWNVRPDWFLISPKHMTSVARHFDLLLLLPKPGPCFKRRLPPFGSRRHTLITNRRRPL